MAVLTSEISDGIATITIARPTIRNALNRQVVLEFHSTLDRLAQRDSGARAVVLTGAGTAFCSGVDLTSVDLSTTSARQTAHFGMMSLLDPLMAKLSEYRYPIVAAVNGPAVGAGMSLALGADIMVIAEGAYFNPSFIKTGFVPDAGVVHHLARRIGGGRSLGALLMSEPIDSAKALGWGLVNEVAPTSAVLPRAQCIARKLACGPVNAIRTLRSLHAIAFNTSLQDYLAKEKFAQMDSMDTGECVEGVRAFFAKRATSQVNKSSIS